MRYFYTDPLAAAWMAKHFGMKFWNEQHEICVIPLVDAEKDGNIYIHPDSMHLLEPRDNDIVTKVKEDGDWYDVGHVYDKQFRDGNPYGDEQAFEGDERIIQRNGIAFMWPESEEVA